MSQQKVVVVGSINVDLVVLADRLPGPGETVVGGDVQRFGGGKGANAAVAAARVGADVALVAAVGGDDFGQSAIAELAADGVDTAGIVVIDGASTGVALIVVNAHGENQIAVGAGANAALSAAMVANAIEQLAPSTACVLVSTELSSEAIAAAVRGARDAGLRCILNPAPPVAVVDELVPLGAVLTPNESELATIGRRLGDGDDPRLAALALARRSGAEVLATLGAGGVLLATPGGSATTIAAPRVDARDTTGAGDTFNGVLAARLAAGEALHEAAGAAVVAASMSVEVAGARTGMPSASALSARLDSR